MENKKNGGNGIYIAIIIVLLGIIAFCAYKIGTTGRCVVDDSNAQKGGNTSVPVEDVTNDTKEVTTTNSGNVKSESADERFKKYAENLKDARSKYDDKNGNYQEQTVELSSDNIYIISLSPNGELSIDYIDQLKSKYNLKKQVVETNVLNFYIIRVSGSNSETLFAIKEDGSISKIQFTEYPCFYTSSYKCNHGTFNLEQNYNGLKNIVTIFEGMGYVRSDNEFATGRTFFVNIDGKMTID